MDGIKKKLRKAPAKEAAPHIQKTPVPYFAKKEELYISKEETHQAEKFEKKFQKGRKIRKFLLYLFFITLLAVFSSAVFFLWKAYNTTKKMNVLNEQTSLSQDIQSILSPIIPSSTNTLLKGQEEGRINILLLGAAGENKPGGNLTDTVMVMSIDTIHQKVALLSLPRDLYVQVGDTVSSAKINSLYKIGISEQKGVSFIKEAVEKITNTTIHYYVVVDFDAFAKIVDDVNGLNIMVERDIYDTSYPGPNYSYETFALKKGAHLLNGDTALKYVRERHDDPEGDFGRAKRQQQVLQSLKNRLFSMQTLFNVVALSKILDTLGDNIKTDMAFDDIEQFIRLSKIIDTQNINNVVVDAWKEDSLLKVSHVMLGDSRAFILIPRIGNYREIQDVAENIFNQAELKKRQSDIINENATIEIINKSNEKELPYKIKKLLIERLRMKNVQIVPNENDEISNISTVSNNSDIEKIFTLDELIKKLPATLDPQKNSSANDITIILGTDLAKIYQYEEDSIDDLNSAQDNQEHNF